MTIWKFEVKPQDVLHVRMPRDAKLLTVQTQAGVPMLWAVVNPEAPSATRLLYVRGTGHPMRDADADYHAYVGTFQLMNGGLVYHVFDGGEQ